MPSFIHSFALPIVFVEGSVQAGFPTPESDAFSRRIDLNDILLIHKDSSFLFRVRGDSMKGIGIYDGDTVVVDRSIEPCNNQIVLAVLDGEFTIKRLVVNNGKYYLFPENDAYPVFELKEGQELQIWGVVTSSIRKYI